MRHQFPVVMAFQALQKDLSNRRVRVGLAYKRLVECVNNQTSKDLGLIALIRPLILLLLLNNIQLCAHLYELKCSEESLSFFHCKANRRIGMQVSRSRRRKVRHLHQTHCQGSKDIGEINEAKDHQALSKGMGHVYNLHKERNSYTTVRKSHNLENVLKRSQVEVVRVVRSGHDAVLNMHTFKHNKSQKQVSI